MRQLASSSAGSLYSPRLDRDDIELRFGRGKSGAATQYPPARDVNNDKSRVGRRFNVSESDDFPQFAPALQSIVRFLHTLVFLLALVLGQATPCRSVYVRGDGSECITCEVAEAAPATQSVITEDCRNCCQLSECDRGHGSTSAQISPSITDVEMALPPELPVIVLQVPPKTAAVSIHVQACLPNAPPAVHFGRAPPFRPI